jgi:hypothetical protein
VMLQTCAPENFRSCRWGDERTVKRAQTGSEDPHRRERNFLKRFYYGSGISNETSEVFMLMGAERTAQACADTGVGPPARKESLL